MYRDDEFDWKRVRFELFNALDTLDVHDIFLVEKEQNILTVSIIVSSMKLIRSIMKMRIIDTLIERKAPDLYRRYMFCYEVWDKAIWDRMSAAEYFNR